MKVPALHLVPKPKEAPDTVALNRLAKGDVSALGEMYDRHAAALFRFASRASGPHDAEDLVQATFMTILKIAGTYDGRTDDARAWLHGVMARLIQERRRSLARFARALLRSRSSPPPVFDAERGCQSDLARGLSTLSDAKRVVLVLAEVEGYTCDEIARMLKVPVGTVWTRLHHARKEMRVFYEEGAP
jgi:RNA polymerase sigma-70 factor (ECF subfamily)